MNTAISSKRNFVSGRHEAVSHKGYTILALVGGFLLMLIGIKMNLTFLAVIGFLPFTMALIYINANFWAEMYDSGKLRTPHFRGGDYPYFD